MKRILWILPLAALLLLTSCLGTAFHTTFNSDGSGTMTMEVTVSQIFMQMGAGEDDSVDIPLGNEEMSAEFEDLPGVEIIDQFEETTEEYTKSSTTISFEDYEVLTSSETMSDSFLERRDGNWVYTMIISEGTEPGEETEEVDEESLAMMKPYFEGYEIVFSVTAPKKIKSYSIGEISEDKKTVVYAIPTLEMNNLNSPEPIIFEVVW